MANGVNGSVKRRGSCTHSRGGYRHKRLIELFLPSQPLGSVAVNIRGQLHKPTSELQHVIVTSSCNLKPTRATSLFETTSTHIANIFLDHRIILYDIPSVFLTEVVTQFVPKIIAKLCRVLGVKHLTTMAYYL